MDSEDLECWEIDLKQITENFRHAKSSISMDPTVIMTSEGKAEQEVQMVGFAFGNRRAHIISNVFFFVSSNDDVHHIAKLHSMLPVGTNLIGVFVDSNLTDFDEEDFAAQYSDFSDGERLKIFRFTDSSDGLAESVLELNASLNSVSNRPVTSAVTAVVSMAVEVSRPAYKKDAPVNVSSYFAEQFTTLEKDVDRLLFFDSEKKLLRESGSSTSNAVKKLKSPQVDRDFLYFSTVKSLSAKSSTEPKLVPIVRMQRGEGTMKRVNFTLKAFVPLNSVDSDADIVSRLREGLRRAVSQIRICFIDQEVDLLPLESLSFLLPGWSSLITIHFPKNCGESEAKKFRFSVHNTLNLPTNQPFVRKSQAVGAASSTSSKLLMSPHKSITNYKPIGEVSLVRGNYNYHHYMQDEFNDNGWGCAYRSLQSVWSWINLNGLSDRPVPCHKEIQQCLFELGDKDSKFVGSRQWIGSFELSLCLDKLLDIQSRIVSVNSGADMAETARQLMYHFDNNGSPVMIGGGMLAHTILGVDYNTSTGACNFLILDPHYTGEENLKTILSKGWCAWKPLSFWDKKSFYNLLLPITPPSGV
ncbi:hypothetical protein QR680_018062 [Steinernema hermaphroditum]|uniref:Ufm1-specific protease n=1 Tax=Steinernema hermaphroditum TaxID=289476 RepID=A0AA39HIV8_9BILA|nr:hypothetical protein QR680_018062 [Steinernema hermaphroditum]